MRSMAPAVISFVLVAGLAACSCGGSGDGGDAAPPDAGADAAQPDGGGVQGSWRLIEQRGAGPPLTPTGADRVNGTLELTVDELGIASAFVTNDRLALPVDPGLVDTYAISSDGLRLELGNGGMRDFALTFAPTRLTLDTDSTYEPMVHQAEETLPVIGVVSVQPGPDPFVPIASARVGLVFLLRSAGQPNIIEVPGGDLPLTGFGSDPSQTAPYDLSRTKGALGVERITFGAAFTSLGLLVVYDDVNGNGLLDELWASCGPGQDCVRGVSPLVVVYRVGSSPELAASPFAFLREGWTIGVPSRDLRTGTERLGVVSLDRAAVQPPPFDVVVPRDPGGVVVPPFAL